METVTITAAHAAGYSPLAFVAVGIVVVGLVAWQIMRTRAGRRDG
ncbi:MAG TPA: hypothetical protein VMG11_01005 [Steroidobacteraceae bacterium]|nr:hypothetical protein [Steroidobacteraceae bacterium]